MAAGIFILFDIYWPLVTLTFNLDLQNHTGVKVPLRHILYCIEIGSNLAFKKIHFFHYLPKIFDFGKYVGYPVFSVRLFVCHTFLSYSITGAVLIWLTWNFHRTCVITRGRNLLKFSIWPWRSRSPEVKMWKHLSGNIVETTGLIPPK